ncbi:lysosomal acid glucosylceramidase-like [Calliopsis andreniformis]|uniref:lysosomal acid glucosylceramidase-like n=1 Tax=Calliopsis andreniformis TaxID=337506 RepID=UPI003FCE364A
MWKELLLITFFFAAKGEAKGCITRHFGVDGIVCVCNATYCDSSPPTDPRVLDDGDLSWYTTTKAGLRMSMTYAKFGSNPRNADTTLIIDSTKKYQTIFGFGGAFTDSAGINIRKLSPATQNQLIRAYYDPKAGSRYMLGRVPIGGTDFSTRPYTYDDVDGEDVQLKKFSLQHEDYAYKIPFMQKALKLNPETKFFGAAWSAPPWMKTNDKINGFGFLKKEYYQVYANYLLKFLDEYKKYGLDIWAFSTGNEPTNAYIPFDPLNTMGWTPESVAHWVGDFMGPTLASSKHNKTLIMAHDDQRLELPWAVTKMLSNKKARKYTAGTAVHWYTDQFVPPNVLDQTHKALPDKFILMTEACIGSSILENPKVKLGSWDRGQKYILSIIQYMNHWGIGWVDWNLALDKQGGPNWINNFVDSPVIVNPETDEFFKQPMYYALQHFSKFVDRGSVRVSITDNYNVKSAAFLTPANETVVVLYNRSNRAKNVKLKDLKRGSTSLEIPPLSMNTILYKV